MRAVHINAAFSRLTGMQNDYVIGKPVSKILALAEQDQKVSEQIMEHKDKEPSSPCISERSKVCLDDLDMKEAPDSDKSSLSSHENMAAVGMRIAETEKRNISIRLLLASNDFGSCYKVNSLEFKGSAMPSDGSNNGSNNSSISSKDLPFNPTLCVMSICPILKNSHPSASNKHPSSTTTPKRRKNAHSHTHGQNINAPPRRSNAKSTTPSHFVIQLFLADEGDVQEAVGESGKVPTKVGIDLSSNNASGGDELNGDGEHKSAGNFSSSPKAVIG